MRGLADGGSADAILRRYYGDPQAALHNPALDPSTYDLSWAPPPVSKPQAELRDPAKQRPDDPFLASARDYLGADAAAKGAYGAGQLLADTYYKGREGDYSGLAENAPMLAMGMFPWARRRHIEEPNLNWQRSPVLQDPGKPSRWISPSDADRVEFTRSKGWAGVNFEPDLTLRPDKYPHTGTGQIAILDPSAARILGKDSEPLAPHEFRAYHGSNVAFDRIDPSKFQTFESSGDLTGSGFYATLSRKDAEDIAAARARALGGKPTVMDVAVDGRRIPITDYDAFNNMLQHWLNEKYAAPKTRQ